jgi:hypothetical protein
MKSVLAIGLDPRFADFSAFPDLNAALVQAYVDAELKRLADIGFEVTPCLVDAGETAEATLRSALASKSFDCVVIGAGLREPAELLVHFEKAINLVHALAPRAKIAFNASPADAVDAVLRNIDA